MAAGKEHFGLVEMTNEHWHIKDKPPLVRHLSRHELHARKAFASYAETLQEDRRVLLQRYRLRDIAFKVVGVGSVGTFCALGLFVSDDDAPPQIIRRPLRPHPGARPCAIRGRSIAVELYRRQHRIR